MTVFNFMKNRKMISIESRSIWLIIISIGLTYVSLGVIFAFIQGGVAPILRSQGMGLSAMRWVYALYLPFGIAFLWAPIVDSWQWPWGGRRTGWILPMQLLAIFAFTGIANLTPGNGSWIILLILGFIVTFSIATVDVVMDALTVEMIPESYRTVVSAIKLGGVSGGALIGGGGLLALYSYIGWHGVTIVITTIIALTCIPVYALIDKEQNYSNKTFRCKARLMQALKKPKMFNKFFRLTLLVSTLLALFNYNRLLLVDMGVPLEYIGGVLGTISPLSNACACLIVPLLISRVSLYISARIVVGICLCSALSIWVGIVQQSANTVIIGSVLVAAGATAMYVILVSLILAWASGQQAATDYALLYGVGRVIGMVNLILLPGIIPLIGWSVFEGFIVLAFGVSAWYFFRLFPKEDKNQSTSV